MTTRFCTTAVLVLTVNSQPPLAEQYGYQSPDGSRTSPGGETVPYYPGVPTPPPAVKYTSPLSQPPSTSPYRKNSGVDGPYARGNPNYVYPPPPVPPPGVVLDTNGNIVACSRDVTRCIDGAYVGRNRENGCQFFNCPAGYWPGYGDGISPPATAPPVRVPQSPAVNPTVPVAGNQSPFVATPQPFPWNRTPKPRTWSTPQPTLGAITPPVAVPTNIQIPTNRPVAIPPPVPVGNNGGGNVPWNPRPTPQPTQWGSGQFVPPPPRTPQPQGVPVFNPVVVNPSSVSPPPTVAASSPPTDDDDGKTAFIIGMVLLVVLILLGIFAAVYLCMKAKSEQKKKTAEKQAERERQISKAVTGMSPPPNSKSLVVHPQFNYPYNNYPVAQPGMKHPPYDYGY